MLVFYDCTNEKSVAFNLLASTDELLVINSIS